jgi:ABC-type transport system involved in Fe-S cluster assembly fused permease/ATPase subunit
MTRLGPHGIEGLRDISQLFWSTASGYVRSRIVLALALIVVSSVITALAPLALKFVVDGFTDQAAIRGLSIFVLVAIYIAAQWLGRVLADIRTLVHGQADRRLYRKLSDRLFAHVMHLPMRFHLERQTGAVNETLSNGLQGTVAFVLVKLDRPIFLLLFLVAVACYGAAFTYGAMRITKAARGASTAQIEARAVMTDSILNYETVKYFTAEPVVRQRLDAALGRTEFEWLRFYRSRTLNGFLVSTIFATFLGVTIFYAAREVMNGRMTVGDFVLVNTYMIQLVTPIEQIGYAMQSLSQGYAFLEKMLDLFREKTEEPNRDSFSARPHAHLLYGPHPRPSPSNRDGIGVRNPAVGGAGASSGAGEAFELRSFSVVEGRGEGESKEHGATGALTFENVSASYGRDRTILKDVSFHVPAGRTLGIVGSSGAGKTSIIRLLFRLYEPTAGRILADGKPISEMPLDLLRSAIAVVPQDTVLFNESIGYNIGFGRMGSAQAEIEQAAKVAHLHEFVSKLPEGYNTKVGERGLKLSGGEKQRVAIARAALKRPRIYVFDEATSSLDSRTEQEILTNIRELSRHATTLIIAHRLSTVTYADEIVVLHGGSIEERGTHASLLALNGRYAELWKAQQPRREDGNHSPYTPLQQLERGIG